MPSLVPLLLPPQTPPALQRSRALWQGSHPPLQSHSRGIYHGDARPLCSWPAWQWVSLPAACAAPLPLSPCTLLRPSSHPRSRAEGLISVGNKVYICNGQLMERVINHSRRLARDMMDFPILTSLNHNQFLLPDLLGLSQKRWAQQCVTKSNLPADWCRGQSPPSSPTLPQGTGALPPQEKALRGGRKTSPHTGGFDHFLLIYILRAFQWIKMSDL